MIHVMHDRDGSTYRVNTAMIACLKFHVSSVGGHVDVDFVFSGGGMMRAEIQTAEFQKFLNLLNQEQEPQ